MARDSEPLQPGPSPDPTRFSKALIGMIRSPRQLVLLWNWKNALLSIVMRGPIFFGAAFRQGWKSAMAALFAESVFCALTAGFYGAVVQTLKDADPQWLTGLFLTLVMPVIFQVLEYVLHWFRGTPHLRVAALVSMVASALAALFNWYAMRRGTMLVGREGGGFGGDLRRLPRLLLGFLAVLPRKIARKFAEKKFAGKGNRNLTPPNCEAASNPAVFPSEDRRTE